MEIRAIIRRAILEQLWYDAQRCAGGSTLEDALIAYRSAQYAGGDAIGNRLIGTSSKGHSVTFSAASSRDLTTEDIFALGQWFLERYRVHKATLEAALLADPLDTYTDDDIVALMNAEAVAVRRVGSDFSNLRH